MKRTVLLSMFLLLLISFTTPAQGQVCGDINGDGAIDIVDLVGLVDYIFMNGPAPVNMYYANMNQCDGIDVSDIAYINNYFFMGGPAPCEGPSCTYDNGGSITLDHVDGLIGPGILATGVPITFYFRMTNNTANNYQVFSNGFVIHSVEGADWGTPTIDTVGPLWSLGFYDVFMNVSPGNGSVDTLSIGAFTIMNDPGIPPGFDDVSFTITIGPLSMMDAGKTITLDSSFFAPAGNWKWATDGVYSSTPEWGGGNTFAINNLPSASISIDNVIGGFSDSTIITNQIITFELRYTNNIGYAFDGITNGFRIYSPDGATWTNTVGDTTGALGVNEFDLGIFIDTFSLDGMGSDTVGFGGVKMYGTGLVNGFDDIPFTVSIGPIDPVYEGKTICVDSSWYPPINQWLWASSDGPFVSPFWGGPYCYGITNTQPNENYLDVTPGSLYFSTIYLTGDPPPQTIFVHELNGGSITYNASSNVPWLNINVTNGMTPDSIVANAIVDSLPPGQYSGTVTITSPDAINSPQYVNVSLNIINTPEAAIWLDHVDGEIGPGLIRTGMPVTFNLRVINSSGYTIGGLTNGFKVYSPDGAQWNTLVGDTIGSIGGDMFNLTFAIQYFSQTGFGADTVGFGGAVLTSPGMPNGFNEVSYAITIGPIDSIYEGNTICLDSSYYPPNVWLWASIGGSYVVPEWSGPHCYTIIYSDQPPPPEGGDSLIIPSMTVAGGGIQPVMSKLTQPIKGATIPIRIPEGATIDSVTTQGLVTENWDYTFIQIKPDSNFIMVALANSMGAVIPPDTTTLFNIYYGVSNSSCDSSYYFSWDTTLMGDVSRQLTFSDTSALPLYPSFDVNRDVVELLPFLAGDCNNDGLLDIADLVCMVDYMFYGNNPPVNINSIDVNGDCVGPDIADLVYMVDHMFQGMAAPQCGCVSGGPKVNVNVNPEISLNTVYENGATIVMLNSAVDLRGIQLELQGKSNVEPVKLFGDNLDLIYGETENGFKAGILDLDGGEYVKAGNHKLIKLEGEYNLVSATVADMEIRSTVPMINNKLSIIPKQFELFQNYPNPFNPNTEIGFSLPEASFVKLEIFNITGQKVATLVENELEAGVYTFEWNGSKAASGIYLYRLDAGTFTTTKKMILLK